MKLVKTSILTTLFVIALAFASYAAEVSGNTIVYSISGKPSNRASTYYVYLISDGATIKCYGNMSTQAPNAKLGNTYNRKYLSKAVSAGSVDTRTGLADSVRFTYTVDKNGVFYGTVTITGPKANLTGVSFVARDSTSHYYAINETGNISSLVYAARNPIKETVKETIKETEKETERETEKESETKKEPESKEVETLPSKEVNKIKDSIGDIPKSNDKEERPPCVLRRLYGYISS